MLSFEYKTFNWQVLMFKANTSTFYDLLLGDSLFSFAWLSDRAMKMVQGLE